MLPHSEHRSHQILRPRGLKLLHMSRPISNLAIDIIPCLHSSHCSRCCLKRYVSDVYLTCGIPIWIPMHHCLLIQYLCHCHDIQLVNILPPLAIRHAVDAISDFAAIASDESEHYQAQTARTVTFSILLYFAIQTVNSALSCLQSISQRSVSLDAERRFATALFSHLHLLGPAYHLERHAGELLRVLSRGSEATSTIIDSLWFNLFPTLFEAVVVAAVFWKFGVASIAVSTLISVALYLIYTASPSMCIVLIKFFLRNLIACVSLLSYKSQILVWSSEGRYWRRVMRLVE